MSKSLYTLASTSNSNAQAFIPQYQQRKWKQDPLIPTELMNALSD